MSETPQNLIDRLRKNWDTLTEEQIDESLALLERDAADRIDALCGREVASFEAGPLLWLTRYTKTENPQYEDQGLAFIAPFPRKTYFLVMFQEFLARHRQLAVAKSRTMMTSWAVAAFSTWLAQWKKEETVIQTHNLDKAQRMINYADQLLRHQDPGLSKLHPIKKQNAFSITWQSGGSLTAIPGGADAIRSFHPSLFVMDECARVEGGEASLNAALGSNCRVILVSTAAPGWFADMCGDYASELPSQSDMEHKPQITRSTYPYPIDRRDYDPQGL